MFFEEEVNFDAEHLSELVVSNLKGLYQAGVHIVDTILHPYDRFIVPVATLIHDGSVIIATGAVYDDMLTQGQVVSFQRFLDEQPELFHQAYNNLTLRFDGVMDGGSEFASASMPKKVELISENVYGILLTGGATKLAKSMGQSGINFYRYKRNSKATGALTSDELAAGLVITEVVATEAQLPTFNSTELKRVLKTAIAKPAKLITHIVEEKFVHADTTHHARVHHPSINGPHIDFFTEGRSKEEPIVHFPIQSEQAYISPYPPHLKGEYLTNTLALQTLESMLMPSKIKCSISSKITMADLSHVPAVQEYARLMNQNGFQFQFGTQTQGDQINFSARVGSAALSALLHPPSDSLLYRLNSELSLTGYIATTHGSFLHSSAKRHLQTRHQAMASQLTQFTPDNESERDVFDVLKSKHAHLGAILNGIQSTADNTSKDVKEILSRSKTTEELTQTVVSRMDELLRNGTDTDKQILSYVKAIAEHQEAEALHNQFFRTKRAEREKSIEMSQKLDGTGQCAMALAGLAQGMGNRELAKPLTMIGATCQGLAAASAFSAASGGAALCPLAGMICAATTVLSTFFGNDNDDDALVEYLQHISEQIGFLRQEVFELKQFMFDFRKDLYQHLHLQFGEVHRQLSYLSEAMRNTAKRSDYKSDRILQGIEAILSGQQQPILRQALSYGLTIPLDVPRNEALALLSQVIQLIDSASTAYYNGGALSQPFSLPLMEEIQQRLNGDLLQRGPFFGYLANTFPEQLKQKMPMVNPLLWAKAVEGYIAVRRTFIARRVYDKDLIELQQVIEQGEQFKLFMETLRKEAPALLGTLVAEINAAIKSIIDTLQYPEAMHTVLTQRDDTPPNSLRTLDVGHNFPLQGNLYIPDNHNIDGILSEIPKKIHHAAFKQYLNSGTYSIPKVFYALESLKFGSFKMDYIPTAYQCESEQGYPRISILNVYFIYNKEMQDIQTIGLSLNPELLIAGSQTRYFKYVTNPAYERGRCQRPGSKPVFPQIYIGDPPQPDKKQLCFTQAGTDTAKKVLLHYRNNHTKILLQNMQQNLNDCRERFIKSTSDLNILLACLGMNHAKNVLPKFNFPEALSSWVNIYEDDLLKNIDPFKPLPLSEDILPTLKMFKATLERFQNEQITTILTKLESAHSPELERVCFMLWRLSALQGELSLTQVTPKPVTPTISQTLKPAINPICRMKPTVHRSRKINEKNELQALSEQLELVTKALKELQQTKKQAERRSSRVKLHFFAKSSAPSVAASVSVDEQHHIKMNQG